VQDPATNPRSADFGLHSDPGLQSGRRPQSLPFLVALLLGALFGWNLPESAPTLTFLSVGQGSCAVLRAGGRTILFDAGPKNEFIDGGRLFVLPKLRAMGVSRVDAVVLSHPDLDHAGGL